MDIKKSGMSFGILSAIFWGTYGTFYSLLLGQGVTDITLVTLAPLSLVIYFGLRVLFKPGTLKAIPLKYYIAMILQGFFITNGMNYCYSQAYANGMAVGIVSVIAFTNILVIMVESYFLMRYKFTASKVISMFLALVGISFVLEVFTQSDGMFTAVGLIWTLLIPLFYGTNITMNSYFIVKKCDSDAILFITQLAALVFMIVFRNPGSLFGDIISAISNNTSTIWMFLGFCGIPMIFCYAMMQESLKRIEPSIMGICYSLDPVTSFILGIIVFAQPIHVIQVIGIIMILAAVVYINVAEGKEAAAGQ